jgi:hypothetical protein
MTELFVAKVNNVIKGTDGSLHRVHKGVTLAEAGHPVVQAAPQAFQPVTIHLPDPSGPLEDEVAEIVANEVGEVTADRDRYRDQLAAIVDLLDERGCVGPQVDRTREGWLAEVLADVLPVAVAAPEPDAAPPVAPPRAASKPRKTAAKPAASDG